MNVTSFTNELYCNSWCSCNQYQLSVNCNGQDVTELPVFSPFTKSIIFANTSDQLDFTNLGQQQLIDVNSLVFTNTGVSSLDSTTFTDFRKLHKLAFEKNVDLRNFPKELLANRDSIVMFTATGSPQITGLPEDMFLRVASKYDGVMRYIDVSDNSIEVLPDKFKRKLIFKNNSSQITPKIKTYAHNISTIKRKK